MYKPFVIVIFGSPGSGKSTQADLLAEKYGIVHFNTGRYVEHFIYDPKLKNKTEVKKARHAFETGGLVDSEIILEIIKKQILRLSKQGESIVFSGSPRTFFEAFGSTKKKGMMDTLCSTYGKERVYILRLDLPKKVAGERNKKRLVCGSCKKPLIGTISSIKLNTCPFCGGKTYKRTLDTKEVIEKRHKEYEKQTFPIYEELRKKHFILDAISAIPLPYKIFENLSKKIDTLINRQ